VLHSRKSIYKKIGNYVGLIFQLRDDCLDFENTADTAKKPVQSDFEQGVITLPLIHSFNRLPSFKKRAMEKNITREDINNAVALAEGLDYTNQIIRRYYRKAEQNISRLDVSEEKRQSLTAILKKASGINA
jgi:heptaprenyl diphosphate synthase